MKSIPIKVPGPGLPLDFVCWMLGWLGRSPRVHCPLNSPCNLVLSVAWAWLLEGSYRLFSFWGDLVLLIGCFLLEVVKLKSLQVILAKPRAEVSKKTRRNL